MRIGTLGQQNLEGGRWSVARSDTSVKLACESVGENSKSTWHFWLPFHSDTSLTLLHSFGTQRILTCRLHFRSLAKLLNLRFFPATQHQPWPLYCNQILCSCAHNASSTPRLFPPHLER